MKAVIWGTVSVVFVDLLSKYLVTNNDWVEVHYNNGYAFSLTLAEPWRTIILGIAYVCLLILLTNMRHRYDVARYRVSVVFVLGGATANIIDRVFRNGYVVDFIAIPYFSIFNIADMCITLGVIMLLYAEFRRSYGKPRDTENFTG